MISREQLKNEIDTIDDTHLEVLYRIILAFKPSPTNGNNPTNETAIEQDLNSPNSPSLFSRLREIKISGPADFSENLDAYLNGEKNV